jgi:hypothetical protein
VLSVTVDFKVKDVIHQKQFLLGNAQSALDLQIIKDSNYFCPQDEGYLQASAITASKVGEGELEWNMPYARAQYYGLPNKATDKNINARVKWFEEAKAQFSGDWERIANEAYFA